MPKKSIIAVLSAVVLMVVASIALVFTVGPKASAADETVYLVPTEYLNLTNDGKTLGDNSFNGGNAFNADGKTWTQNYAKYYVEIPAGVTSIGKNAFCCCSGLTSIIIPESVTYISEAAFEGCSGLTSITIPESVTIIDECTFFACSGLKSITIPAGVTSIGESAFRGCIGLTSITISEGVTSIGYDAFMDCYGLTSITIPESVKSIGYQAFYACRGLTSITIPNSVTRIGQSAFNNCSGLNEIIVRNPGLIGNTNLTYGNSAKVYLGADQNTVSFVTNCDTTIDSRLIDFGEVTTEPTTALTKEHYTFAGWYSDEQYTKPFTFDTPIKHDIILYAKWQINQYTVTFDSKQGSSVLPQTVNWNTKISRPSDPVREGYDFLGWYLNNEEYNFEEFVTDNMTLTARWKSNNPDDPADPTEENPAVNNQNNSALIWGIAGTAAGILIIGGIVFGIVISKRRRK